MPGQYGTCTDPDGGWGNEGPALCSSSPLPGPLPLPPSPPVVFRYPISRAVWAGSAQAVQGSNLSGLDLSWGSPWPLNRETNFLGISELSFCPYFSVHGLLRDTHIVSHLCARAGKRGRRRAASICPGVCRGVAPGCGFPCSVGQSLKGHVHPIHAAEKAEARLPLSF